MHHFCNAKPNGAECGARLEALGAVCKACGPAAPALAIPPPPAVPSLDSLESKADDDAATAVESPVAKKKNK
jgi:hypothetical protein